MKKIFLFVFGLMFTANAYADIISVPAFSADSGVPHLEYFRTTVVNAINGQVQGSGTTGSTTNILADSLGELDMADEINPRIRANEILGIGVDTTSVQTAFVASGLTPATSASLTSNISAGVAYINGYRVAKNATSKTYSASMDTYVDLDQTGGFTLSAVVNGAAAPAVAANSARLAKVVTDGTSITSVTNLANRAVPGLVVPQQYRTGYFVSRDSATTVTAQPGSVELNGSMVSKIALTQLGISVAGDWAGGISLRAADTYAFVGIDASGNLKLHTTAPAYDNYDLTTTAGKKRYASWSSTTFRILGWFYMDGAQNVEVASNIKEGDVSNCIISSDEAVISFTATTMTPSTKVRFYSSGGPTLLMSIISGDSAGGNTAWDGVFDVDGTNMAASAKSSSSGVGANYNTQLVDSFLQTGPTQSTHTYQFKHRTSAGNAISVRSRNQIVIEQ